MSNAYRAGLAAFANKEIDFDTDTIKAMAVKTGYSFDGDAHVYLSDVSASRYVGTTDQTLAGRAITTQAGRIVELDSTGCTWSSVTLDGGNNIIGVIVYHDTGVAGTSKLLAYDTLVAPVTPDGNNVVYTPASTGIIKFTG